MERNTEQQEVDSGICIICLNFFRRLLALCRCTERRETIPTLQTDNVSQTRTKNIPTLQTDNVSQTRTEYIPTLQTDKVSQTRQQNVSSDSTKVPEVCSSSSCSSSLSSLRDYTSTKISSKQLRTRDLHTGNYGEGSQSSSSLIYYDTPSTEHGLDSEIGDSKEITFDQNKNAILSNSAAVSCSKNDPLTYNENNLDEDQPMSIAKDNRSSRLETLPKQNASTFQGRHASLNLDTLTNPLQNNKVRKVKSEPEVFVKDTRLNSSNVSSSVIKTASFMSTRGSVARENVSLRGRYMSKNNITFGFSTYKTEHTLEQENPIASTKDSLAPISYSTLRSKSIGPYSRFLHPYLSNRRSSQDSNSSTQSMSLCDSTLTGNNGKGVGEDTCVHKTIKADECNNNNAFTRDYCQEHSEKEAICVQADRDSFVPIGQYITETALLDTKKRQNGDKNMTTLDDKFTDNVLFPLEPLPLVQVHQKIHLSDDLLAEPYMNLSKVKSLEGNGVSEDVSSSTESDSTLSDVTSCRMFSSSWYRHNIEDKTIAINVGSKSRYSNGKAVTTNDSALRTNGSIEHTSNTCIESTTNEHTEKAPYNRNVSNCSVEHARSLNHLVDISKENVSSYTIQNSELPNSVECTIYDTSLSNLGRSCGSTNSLLSKCDNPIIRPHISVSTQCSNTTKYTRNSSSYTISTSLNTNTRGSGVHSIVQDTFNSITYGQAQSHFVNGEECFPSAEDFERKVQKENNLKLTKPAPSNYFVHSVGNPFPSSTKNTFHKSLNTEISSLSSTKYVQSVRTPLLATSSEPLVSRQTAVGNNPVDKFTNTPVTPTPTANETSVLHHSVPNTPVTPTPTANETSVLHHSVPYTPVTPTPTANETSVLHHCVPTRVNISDKSSLSEVTKPINSSVIFPTTSPFNTPSGDILTTYIRNPTLSNNSTCKAYKSRTSSVSSLPVGNNSTNTSLVTATVEQSEPSVKKADSFEVRNANSLVVGLHEKKELSNVSAVENVEKEDTFVTDNDDPFGIFREHNRAIGKKDTSLDVKKETDVYESEYMSVDEEESSSVHRKGDTYKTKKQDIEVCSIEDSPGVVTKPNSVAGVENMSHVSEKETVATEVEHSSVISQENTLVTYIEHTFHIIDKAKECNNKVIVERDNTSPIEKQDVEKDKNKALDRNNILATEEMSLSEIDNCNDAEYDLMDESLCFESISISTKAQYKDPNVDRSIVENNKRSAQREKHVRRASYLPDKTTIPTYQTPMQSSEDTILTDESSKAEIEADTTPIQTKLVEWYPARSPTPYPPSTPVSLQSTFRKRRILQKSSDLGNSSPRTLKSPTASKSIIDPNVDDNVRSSSPKVTTNHNPIRYPVPGQREQLLSSAFPLNKDKLLEVRTLPRRKRVSNMIPQMDELSSGSNKGEKTPSSKPDHDVKEDTTRSSLKSSVTLTPTIQTRPVLSNSKYRVAELDRRNTAIRPPFKEVNPGRSKFYMMDTRHLRPDIQRHLVEKQQRQRGVIQTARTKMSHVLQSRADAILCSRRRRLSK